LTELTDWSDAALLCHNTLFDGAILAWRFGIKPAFLLDTLSMARALHGVDAGGSLAALAERYEIGKKGTEVEEAKGKKLEDFAAADLKQYGEYCKNDVELTYKLFHLMAPAFPADEIKLIDMTLRMFIFPAFKVDDALLVERLEELKQEKHDLLATLKERLKCDDEEAVRKKLASNKQFAGLLTEHGITPPTKVSPTTEEKKHLLWQRTTKVLFHCRNMKIHSFNNYVLSDLELNQLWKSLESQDSSTLESETRDYSPSHLNIMERTQVGGAEVTRLTSKTFLAEIRKRKHLKTQYYPLTTAWSLTVIRPKLRLGCWLGFQDKTMSYNNSVTVMTYIQSLRQKCTTVQ